MFSLKTVSLLWVKGLLQAGVMQGLSEANILSRAGLKVEQLSTDRISLDDTLSIWRSIEELSADPLFGFHMGKSLQPTHFQIIAFTLLSSPTLGEAIEKILKYQRLISDGGDFSLIELSSIETGLVYAPTADNFSYHQIDAAMVAVVSFSRWLLGHNFQPNSILFNHAEQGGLAEYQDFFGCTVNFNQDKNCIVFKTELLARSLPGYLPQLETLHEQMADSHLQRLAEPDIVNRLLELLADSSDYINRDKAALQLGMSGRSLQRKLQEEGSSFQKIYDDFRHQKSLQLLQTERLSLLDISLQLGFSESSTFYRAFKRWQGITPGEYRQQLHQDD